MLTLYLNERGYPPFHNRSIKAMQQRTGKAPRDVKQSTLCNTGKRSASEATINGVKKHHRQYFTNGDQQYATESNFFIAGFFHRNFF